MKKLLCACALILMYTCVYAAQPKGGFPSDPASRAIQAKMRYELAVAFVDAAGKAGKPMLIAEDARNKAADEFYEAAKKYFTE